MRSRRDALARDIASKQTSITELQDEVGQLKVQLSSESEARIRVQESAQLEASKAMLVSAFLNIQRQQEAVWQEYRARLREKAKLDISPASESNKQQQQYFTDDAGNSLTATQRNLCAALQSLQQSFEHTFQLALDRQPQSAIPSKQQEDAAEYLRLTVEELTRRDEFRELFSIDRPLSSTETFRAGVFLSDLNSEVQRSIDEVARRIMEAEAERNAESVPADKQAESEKPLKPSIRDVFSSLISSLQAESTGRFLQAQQLANETDGGEEILNELIRKQRQGDEEILNAPSDEVSLETKHTLLAVRKLQHLQRHHAALKAQMAFAQKTYTTFAGIRDARQTAMDAFQRQKDRVTSFPSARRVNEQALVVLVGENKIMRRKIQEYAGRVAACVAGDLAPACARLERASLALLDSTSGEGLAGLSSIHSPLSLLEQGVEEGGRGRVPVERLAIRQVQQATSQTSQLHAFMMHDGHHSERIDLVRNPSAIVWKMQELATEAAHLALLQRAAALAHQSRLDAASAASGGFIDVTSPVAWTQLTSRIRAWKTKRAGDWTTALKVVLQRATETHSKSLPRVRTLLDSFWRQPASSTIPHLRNQKSYNVDDYTQEIRTLMTQIQQSEARYNRALKNKLSQQL
jgi:hypothetical protein